MHFLSHILIAFGAFQALFIAAAFLVTGKSSLPKKCFAIFLLVEGITLIERVLVETDLIQDVPHILGISYPLSFIKAPVLFLMGLAIIHPRFKLRHIHFLHAIPFLVILTLNIPFYWESASYKLKFAADFMEFVPAYNSFEFYLYCTFFLHIGIYVGVTINKLATYRKHVKNNRLANFYLAILSLYGGILGIMLLYFLMRPLNLLEIPGFNTISMLIVTFLVQSVAYKFFANSNMFHVSNAPDLQDAASRANHETVVKLKMEKEKLFLDDGLKLEGFANSVNLPKKYLSDLINQRFGKTFTDWINQYRVEEAKALMKLDSQGKSQLKEIAYDSGFNNKVSFYRTFKRHTGKSPSDYWQDLRNS